MALVRGTAQWAFLNKLDTKFDPCWRVDLIITKEDRDRLISESKQIAKKGMKISMDDEGQFVVKFRRNLERADGKGENKPPRVVDRHKVPFTENIGNGSEVIVQYSLYEWSNKYGTGVGADLKGVQVVTHVPYNSSGVEDGEEFEELEEDASTPSDDEDFEEFDDD